jgi:hypothetical protein
MVTPNDGLYLHAAKGEELLDFFAFSATPRLGGSLEGDERFGDPSLRRNGYTVADLPFEWLSQFAYLAGRDARGFFQGTVVLNYGDAIIPGFEESTQPLIDYAWYRKEGNVISCFPATLKDLRFCCRQDPSVASVTFPDKFRIEPTMGQCGWTLQANELDVQSLALGVCNNLKVTLVWDSLPLAQFIRGLSPNDFDW